MKIAIRIGGQAFAATLSASDTAAAFEAMLPLSVTMHELNGNEKYARLRSALPTHESRPPAIEAGDLMLYGSDTLVLFYESFSTSYRYTRIGRLDDPAGLAAALGPGNVAVTFEAEPARR